MILAAVAAFFSPKQVFVSPVPANYEPARPPISFDKNAALKVVVANSLVGTTGKYAVVIKNLKTGQSFAQNEKEIMPAASLYKIWLAIAVYEDIRDRKIDENKELYAAITDLNNYFGIDELDEGYIDLTVNQAVGQAITISNNYAALLLLKEIGGYNRVEAVLKETGMSSSSFQMNPKTTAADMADLLDKIYKKEAGDSEISEKLIEVMSKGKLNDGLPKYLPYGVTVAHKTGEIDSFKHDAGIIYTPNGDYIIVILSDSWSPFGAEERIAQLSRAVFDYFDSL